MPKLGDILIQAREERGLTLEDAERDTRIARRYLEALEAEAFEVIPAPVYARGFLRSYSQYLGLDPEEVLSLFPRPEEQQPEPPPRRRGSDRDTAAHERRRAAAERRRARPAAETPRPRERREPTIGIELGRGARAPQTTPLQTDPASQTRTMFVAVVALVVVVAVVGIAFAVSQLGNGDQGTGALPGVEDGDAVVNGDTGDGGDSTPPPVDATATAAPAGTVPEVIGTSMEAAQATLQSAGYEVAIIEDTASTAAAGTVVDQAPAPDSPLPAGQTVTIVVSDGPE